LFAAVNLFKTNSLVLDVGSGSGVLSMFAAKAGASRVFAVEFTDMAHLSSKLINHNGLEKIITVIKGAI